MKRLFQLFIFVLSVFFLSSCSAANVQEYDNPEFVEVEFLGLGKDYSHSITNSHDQTIMVSPLPAMDYYNDGKWEDVSVQNGVNSLGPYPVRSGGTERILSHFVIDGEPGQYRIRHYAWFEESGELLEENNEETFYIVVEFGLEE